MKILLCLLMLLTRVPAPPDDIPAALRSGQWLRMHVVAQDDTAEMQRVKLCVRDAVRSAYAAHALPGTMLENAETLLPQLTAIACETARSEGFEGSVAVALGAAYFDSRTLANTVIPAGEYPALIIRMGEARGHNWWGLIDPDTALLCASLPSADDEITWDWSFAALLEAIFGWIILPGGACP